MSIIQWNVRGFSSNREQIKVLLRDHNASIICLQETKLGEVSPNIGLNYGFHRSPPFVGARAQGGTGFFIHKSINYRILQLNSVLQASAVEVFTDKWVTLCSLYLEPKLENRLKDEFGQPRQLHLNDLQSLIDQLPQPFILMGDFNAKHRLWGELTNDRWGCLVEDLIDRNDIILMNDGSPTRHDSFHNSDSAIDLTLCSSSLRLDYSWSVDDNMHGSDHWPIHIKYMKNNPSSCLPKWKTDVADWSLYGDATRVDRGLNDFQSCFTAYEYLVSILICGAMMAIPKTIGKPRRPVVPWWNNDCAISRKVTRSSYKKYRRYPCLINKLIYRRALAKQKKIFKKARRDSFIRYISELKYDAPMNLVWERIRKLQGKFVPRPLPVLKVNGLLISDLKDVAEAFARHFSDISSVLHYTPEFRNVRESTTIIPPSGTSSESYNMPFIMEELDNALASSSPTSPGEDEVLYSMILHLPQCTKILLLKIFNKFWMIGVYPSFWKTSVILPFLKPGKDSCLSKSYRPIALTSCVGKLYEKMVSARLVWVLDSRNLLSNHHWF